MSVIILFLASSSILAIVLLVLLAVLSEDSPIRRNVKEDIDKIKEQITSPSEN